MIVDTKLTLPLDKNWAVFSIINILGNVVFQQSRIDYPLWVFGTVKASKISDIQFYTLIGFLMSDMKFLQKDT